MSNGSELIVSLDVGTSKICTIVAEADGENNTVRVIGLGAAPSRGLRKGVIVDMEKAVEAITESVENAEKMTNVEIHSVITGISGGHVWSINSRGVAAVGDPEEISARDVERAVSAARAVSLPADREILHTIPQEYSVDGQGGIKEPEGMSGVRLEAEAHIITGAISAAQNMIKSVNKAGFEVEDLVAGALASSMAVLSEDEKNSGVLLIDIGGGTTDFAVFHRGSIRQSEVIALGGDHITNDISVGLHMPISTAEEVKKSYGSALEDEVDPGDEFEVPAAAGRPASRRHRRELARIVELRMKEILTLVKKQVERAGMLKLAGAGVVITGGASLLDGTSAVAERIFGLPVRIGVPSGISGIAEVLDSPVYAAGAGLARYGYLNRAEGKYRRFRNMGRGGNFFKRIYNWIRNRL